MDKYIPYMLLKIDVIAQNLSLHWEVPAPWVYHSNFWHERLMAFDKICI